MTKQRVIVANPAAGRGRATVVAQTVARLLARADVDARVERTRSPAHAEAVARAAVRAGASQVVVCGGDGTISAVVPALVGGPAALGVLPVGRGNDLARALALPRDPAAAASGLLGGHTRPIDVAMANGRPFLTVSSLGLDARVSHVAAEQRLPLPGSAAYLVAALRCLIRLRPLTLRLSGDFGVLEGRALLVAGANTSSYGGGMRIAPAADPADGLLDLCVVRAAPRRRVVSVLPRVFWGGHVRDPAVAELRTRRARIEVLAGTEQPVWADGEPATETPLDLAVERGGLQVLVPTEEAAPA